MNHDPLVPYDWKLNETLAQDRDWQQFTGLHDKNGKDIYEGDIVENSARTVGLISFEGACFVFVEAQEMLDLEVMLDDRCVVVGNIHENAEILK